LEKKIKFTYFNKLEKKSQHFSKFVFVYAFLLLFVDFMPPPLFPSIKFPSDCSSVHAFLLLFVNFMPPPYFPPLTIPAELYLLYSSVHFIYPGWFLNLRPSFKTTHYHVKVF